jgi:hypothetical protein
MDAADNIRRIKENAKLPKQKKPYRMPKVSEKKKAQMKEEKAIRVAGGSEMDRWFEARRQEMQGYCLHCGGRSCKDNDKYFKFSIAHLLPKNLFKSVRAHPLNWIELCFWDKSCHTNYDNKTLDIIELNCYDVVIERFIAIYPAIAPKERKYIPDVLLQYVKNETDSI